jgi:hypothetical protein
MDCGIESSAALRKMVGGWLLLVVWPVMLITLGAWIVLLVRLCCENIMRVLRTICNSYQC